MRLQNVFTIVALLALAVLVFIVVRSLSAPKPHAEVAKVDRASAPVGHLPQIYVAHNTMEVGTFVGAADLEAHDWPEQAISPSELRVDQVPAADLTGAVVRERMVKGEPIMREKLVRPGDRGFLAAVLLPGMRAITVPIDTITSHSGLLLPGDRIDVILTQNIGGTATGGHAHVGETIMRAVRILAIGTALSPPSKPENIDDHPKSATLEVTPKQAEVLSVATQLGTLALALRSLPATESDEMEDELATTGADLTKPTAPTWGGDVSKAFSGGANIQIMRGSGEGTP